MTERDYFINIPRQECIFHPGENLACVKQIGPLGEGEAQMKTGILRQIFPELGETIEAVKTGNGVEGIPQMCQDCKFRLTKGAEQK